MNARATSRVTLSDQERQAALALLSEVFDGPPPEDLLALARAQARAASGQPDR